MFRPLAVLTTVAIALVAAPRPAAAFDTWWHAECTRKAMEANGFNADSRLVTQFENYLTDVFPGVNIAEEWLQDHKVDALSLPADESYEWMHFDAVFTTKDVIANRMELDSTFLTSSSIVAHHFDGVQPAKHVFNPDADAELHQAYAALGLTVGRYAPFLGQAKNPFHLPSPFWAGHMQFHITHELADGLMLAGKTYNVPHGP